MNKQFSKLDMIDESPELGNSDKTLLNLNNRNNDHSIELISISDEEVQQPRINNEITSNSHNKLVSHSFGHTDIAKPNITQFKNEDAPKPFKPVSKQGDELYKSVHNNLGIKHT